MANISSSLLTASSDETDRTSYSTASISPTSNRLVLAFIASGGAGAGTTPTLSGNGLTWVQVGNSRNDGGVRVTLFRALGASPSTGAVTIDFSGVTQSRCHWHIIEFSNINTTGTNGSGAIVQSVDGVSANTTSFALTLGAFGDSANATYGAMCNNGQPSGGIVQGSGFTEIADVLDSGPAWESETEFRTDNSTTVNWSWTGNQISNGFAVEIKNATPSPIAGGDSGYSYFM